MDTNSKVSPAQRELPKDLVSVQEACKRLKDDLGITRQPIALYKVIERGMLTSYSADSNQLRISWADVKAHWSLPIVRSPIDRLRTQLKRFSSSDLDALKTHLDVLIPLKRRQEALTGRSRTF